MDKKILSQNLKHYRIVFGLTQEEAAEAAGITRGGYVKIENGTSMPGDDVVRALCERYRIKMVDLFQSLEVPKCAFLTKACVGKEALARRRETIRRVCRMASDRRMLRELTGFDVKADEERLGKVRGEIGCDLKKGVSQGRAVRNRLWPSGLYTPESIPLAIDHAGIIFCVMPFLFRDTDGFSFYDAKIGWVIAVNADRPFEAQAMAMAHELGHILQGTADCDHGSKGRHDKAEEAAVRFARELLIPRGAFVARWNELAAEPFVQKVLAIKREFKVEARTVLHQAVEFRLADSGVYAEFASQLKWQGLSASPDPYPCNDRLADTMYDALAVRACVEGEITMSRCAELLGCSLMDVRKILNERSR